MCSADAQTGSLRPLDLLLVIENSGSIVEEQWALGDAFLPFVDSLRGALGQVPELHVGVVSSDVGAGNRPVSGTTCGTSRGDAGRLKARAECGLLEGARFLDLRNGGAVKNSSENLDDTVKCMVNQGSAGCAFEHHLEALRLALSPNETPANAGFLRPDAHLAIVMLAHEDDCSAPYDTDLFVDPAYPTELSSLRCNLEGHMCNGMPLPQSPIEAPLASCAPRTDGRLVQVQAFVDAIKASKHSASQVTLSVITGLPADRGAGRYVLEEVRAENGRVLLADRGICTSKVGSAGPALRLQAVVDALAPNSSIDSICTGDLKPAMNRIVALVAPRLRDDKCAQ